MEVRDAQREVRATYLGGAPGQAVSALLWALSAAAATWGTERQAMVILVVGGFFIFPATMLWLRLLGRPAALARGNPLGGLAMQVAFTIPASYPLIAMAVAGRPEWFYPAFMIVVGAHYLPFIFLYGMPHFGGVALALIGGALAVVRLAPGQFAIGGWLTGALLFAAAGIGWWLSRSGRAGEDGQAGRPATV